MGTGRPSRRATAAAMIGNVFEWYDFAVYGFFAASIGQHFFPDDDPSVSVVVAFGVFAIGFLARPLGAVILGHLGDLMGRRRVMMLSVLLMAVPTFLIGVMPTYDTLGVMAPVILILLRLLQGASVGGEMTSSVTFLIEEVAPAQRQGFAASWCFSGSIAGVLLGSATGSVIALLLSPEDLAAWGWRIPFLLGVVIAVAGFVMRRELTDDAERPHWQSKPDELPLWRTVRDHGWDFVRAIGITAYDAAGFYLMFVYITTWLTGMAGEGQDAAFDVNTSSMVVLVALIPLFGALGDRIGLQRMCLLSSGAGVVLTLPLFLLLDHSDPWLALAGELGFVVILAPFIGCFGARIALMFPRDIRMSAFSVSYNIGLAVFGGTAPMLASWMIEEGSGVFAPGYLLTGAALISFVALLSARRSPT